MKQPITGLEPECCDSQPNRTLTGVAMASLQRAPVAQLDSAAGFYPDGCRFESCRGRAKHVTALHIGSVTVSYIGSVTAQ